METRWIQSGHKRYPISEEEWRYLRDLNACDRHGMLKGWIAISRDRGNLLIYCNEAYISFVRNDMRLRYKPAKMPVEYINIPKGIKINHYYPHIHIQWATCGICYADHDVRLTRQSGSQMICGECLSELAYAHASRDADAYFRQRRLATPRWADREKIDAIYEEARRLTFETGIPHQVDHEIPLRHPLVAGLHVPANLRVITAKDNGRKGNKFSLPNGRSASIPACYSSNVETSPTIQDAPKSGTSHGSRVLPRLRKRIQASSA